MCKNSVRWALLGFFAFSGMLGCVATRSVDNPHSDFETLRVEFAAAQKAEADRMKRLERVEREIEVIGRLLEGLINGMLAAQSPENANAIAGAPEPAPGLEAIRKLQETIMSGALDEMLLPRDALMARASIYRDAGDWSRTSLCLEEFLARFPDDPEETEVRYHLGLVFFMQGDYPQAIFHLQKIVERGEEGDIMTKAGLTLGEAFYRNGEKRKSLLVFQDVLKRNPDRDAESKAVRWIEQLEDERGER